jgi:hypothetical protein
VKKLIVLVALSALLPSAWAMDDAESIFSQGGLKVEKISSEKKYDSQTKPMGGLKMDMTPAVTGRFAVQVSVGTTGVVLGAAFKEPQSRVGYRAELSSASISRDYSDGATQVSTKLKNRSVDLLADYHVFSGRFRVTAGLTTGKKEIDGNGTYTQGATSTPVSATASFPSTMPYLGVGYSSVGTDEPGLGFSVDLGAYVGKAKGDLTASDPTVAASADFQAEQAKYRDDVAKYKFYPVLKVGANYRF